MPTEYSVGERGTKVKVMARKWQECWAVDKDKDEEGQGLNKVTGVKKRD